MLKSYEAIYKNGQLQRIGEAPPQEDARVIVTVTERSPGRIEAAAPNGHRFVALAKQMAATGIADKLVIRSPGIGSSDFREEYSDVEKLRSDL